MSTLRRRFDHIVVPTDGPTNKSALTFVSPKFREMMLSLHFRNQRPGIYLLTSLLFSGPRERTQNSESQKGTY